MVIFNSLAEGPGHKRSFQYKNYVGTKSLSLFIMSFYLSKNHPLINCRISSSSCSRACFTVGGSLGLEALEKETDIIDNSD